MQSASAAASHPAQRRRRAEGPDGRPRVRTVAGSDRSGPARGRLPGHANVTSSTPRLARTLCGNREWGPAHSDAATVLQEAWAHPAWHAYFCRGAGGPGRRAPAPFAVATEGARPPGVDERVAVGPGRRPRAAGASLPGPPDLANPVERKTQNPKASSSTSTQCRTGVAVPLCRCVMQPMLALAITAGRSSSRWPSLRSRRVCAISGLSTE